MTKQLNFPIAKQSNISAKNVKRTLNSFSANSRYVAIAALNLYIFKLKKKIRITIFLVGEYL